MSETEDGSAGSGSSAGAVCAFLGACAGLVWLKDHAGQVLAWVLVLVLIAAVGFCWLVLSDGSDGGGDPWDRLPLANRKMGGLADTLRGRSTDWDALLLELGLARVTAEGKVERPTAVKWADRREETGAIGLVVRPLPGTIRAWERAEAELRHAIAEEILLDFETPGEVLLIAQVRSAPVVPEPEPVVAVDPLAAVVPVRFDQVPPDWCLRLGMQENGFWLDVPLADRAGFLVAGEPGGGKTASVRSAVAWSLARLAHVQFAVIDGKGGHDWRGMAPRCFEFVSTSRDLDAVLGVLESLVVERERRADAVWELRGHSSFWEAGPSEDMPLIVLIVDECKMFFQKGQYAGDKQAIAKIDRITALLESLLSLGRSAGICTILMTQKATTDAIPSSIRDLAGIRAAFPVVVPSAADGVFGAGWRDEVGPSPAGELQGVAAVAAGRGGGRVRVKGPWISESDLAGWMGSLAGATRDPRGGVRS